MKIETTLSLSKEARSWKGCKFAVRCVRIEEGESELALNYLTPILIIFTFLPSFKYILMLFPKFSELVSDLLMKYQIGFILGVGEE